VIQLTGFKRLWLSEKLPDEDLQALEMAIMRDPAAGAVMRVPVACERFALHRHPVGKGRVVR
jgi:hypothetical protein